MNVVQIDLWPAEPLPVQKSFYQLMSNNYVLLFVFVNKHRIVVFILTGLVESIYADLLLSNNFFGKEKIVKCK